jgi:hypothetical protein
MDMKVNLVVSLSKLLACRERKWIYKQASKHTKTNKQTNKQTDRQTDRQTDSFTHMR